MMERKAFIDDKENSNWRELKNKLFFWVVVVLSALTISPIILIVYELLVKGLKQINFDFFFKVAPDTLQAMTAVRNGEIIPGGIANGITGTMLMVVVASVIAIPVSILIGIFLYENQGKKYANLIRSLTDILQGVPSVVLGLIAYIWIVQGVT